MILIDGYPVDASLSEDHNFDSEVTRDPVERGADITDHIRKLPISVTIEGVVSDTPIGDAAVARDVVLEGEGERSPETTYSAEALGVLLGIRDRGEPVTIVTNLRVYDNMALERLNVPVDAETGAALRFTASFVEVVIAENRRTRVRTATPRGQGKNRRGYKPSKATTPTPGTTTYWCVEDRTVFVRPEDLALARRYQKSTSAGYWTDFRQDPTPEYTQPILLCTVKRTITRNSDGNLTVIGVDGKPRELLPSERFAAEADAKERTGMSDLNDPIDNRTGQPISRTDLATKKKVEDALTKPVWVRKAQELQPQDATATSTAAEKARIEQYVRRLQGGGL